MALDLGVRSRFADSAKTITQAKPVANLQAGETIISNIGCISITGKEPGYKKVNQDKVCVLAQYLSPHQSFFTALDGHGPHGVHLTIVLGCVNVNLTF